VAAPAPFLASDDARYVSGTAMPIDVGIPAGLDAPLPDAAFGES